MTEERVGVLNFLEHPYFPWIFTECVPLLAVFLSSTVERYESFAFGAKLIERQAALRYFKKEKSDFLLRGLYSKGN